MKFRCILCGNRTYRVLYPSSIIAQTSEDSLCLSTGRQSATHGQIVKCGGCDLVSTFPHDDETLLAAAYRSLCDPEYLAERTARIINASRHLRFVQRFKQPEGRLLDVGSSAGFFLSVAQKQGWEVTGIEPSRWASRVARTEYGIEDVHEGFLEQVNLEGLYDAVTLWDVLEHLPDPTSALGTIARVLKRDSMIYLNLPNVDSVAARIQGRHWVLLLREHLWYFSPRTITRLLEQMGFEVLDIRPNVVTFSVRGILSRLLQYSWLASSRALKALANNSHVNGWRVTFGMGEMLVAARPVAK